MSATPRTRFALGLGAAALVGGVLPLASTMPAGAAEDATFSGFATSGWAAPVKLEIYEPTVPIPASPQLEFEFGYSAVEADSGTSRGRASWLWPGDPVGEGWKTIMENLKLPPELSGPIAAGGYPYQVNSTQPSGESHEADEPFPGTVMRTGASPQRTYAEVGLSPDNDVSEPPQGGGDGGDGGDEGGPGLPDPPAVPGVPTLPVTAAQQFSHLMTGRPLARQGSAAEEPGEGGSGNPGLPPEIAALVDFSGYTSSTVSDPSDDLVRTTARSSVAEVSLLGGVITIAGVKATAVATSDGTTGTATGASKLGTMSIGGNEFTVGPDGIEASGQQAPIPGLPDEPAAALAQLGISIEVVKPQLAEDGDQASAVVQGLRITIDSAVLRAHLQDVPFGQIIGQIPNETGQLKGYIESAVYLSPRFVITLGNAVATTDTVDPLPTPHVPDPDDGDDAGDPDGGEPGSATGTSGSGDLPPPLVGGTDAGGDVVPTADGDLADAAPVSSGLPPLFSIPGALLLGGIALAAAGGSYFRKLGLLALGGAGSCTHGLDSGLPDLRKA